MESGFAHSALSLVVPLFVVVMVVLSRRVVLSLFLGVCLSGLMLYGFSLESLHFVYKAISSVFYDEGINWDGAFIFAFLIILGVITQIILYSGAIGAFVKWARNHIKTAKGSEFLAFVAGVVIFIDDYFNALTVGQISRSLNDSFHSSRERLAYIIDSTSAPICILIPLSSWGAYNIGLLSKQGIEEPFVALLQSIPNNFYAFFALIAVVLTIIWRVNLPVMRNNVNVGMQDSKAQDSKINGAHIFQRKSAIIYLIVPILALIVGICFMIFYTGFQGLEDGESGLIAMLSHTDTPFSLFCGGAFALVVTLLMTLGIIESKEYPSIFWFGAKSMFGAILILIFAWAIGPVIKEHIQTGVYLANVAKDVLSADMMVFMPVFLFLISAFIAFCTGTSWGTFAIMLPIGMEVTLQSGSGEMTQSAFLALSAILSGAVYGDHTSPISDTTILSAVGAGCSVQSHFITQFPYTSIAALCAGISFVLLALTQSTLIAFCVGFVLLGGIFYILKRFYGGDIESIESANQ